jgi:hypothetical protein
MGVHNRPWVLENSIQERKKKLLLGRKNTAGVFAWPILPMGAFVFAHSNTSLLYCILSTSG